MQLEQLLYFTKIVETSSFAAASKELFITQQALSVSIKKLEKELQSQLLERTKYGIHLLDDGKYVYKKAKEILSSCDELCMHFQMQSQFSAETLTVATNYSIKEFVLPKVITYFLRMHPETKINYVTAENKKIIELIENGEADIGLLPYLKIDKNTTLSLPSHITFTPLYKFTFDCICSTESAFAKYNSVSISTIVKKNLIVNTYSNTNMDNNIIQQLIHHFFSNANIIEADNSALYWQLIHDNLGIGIFPHLIEMIPQGFISIPISDNIKCYGGYILNTENDLNSILLNAFLKKLKEYNQFIL